MGLTVLILQVCLSYSPFRKNLLSSCLESPPLPRACPQEAEQRPPRPRPSCCHRNRQMGGWVDGGFSDKRQVRHGLGMHHR